MRDLDKLALALPETTKKVSEDGRPEYLVHGKAFCLQRGRRADAIDPETGERMDDVLMFRVDGADAKELVLSDPRKLFFTTPHFDGYPAVLIRIRDLAQLDVAELRDAVVEAWLTKAQKRVAKAWLGSEGESWRNSSTWFTGRTRLRSSGDLVRSSTRFESSARVAQRRRDPRDRAQQRE